MYHLYDVHIKSVSTSNMYVYHCSHWGKFGQRNLKSRNTYISEPQEYVKMMTDSSIVIQNMIFINEDYIILCWISKKEFTESLSNTSVAVAAFTTAQARLKLYTLLEGLQERAVYYDTDR